MTTAPGTADVLPDFKRAMRRLASTVAIVSTRHDGRRYGMAATAVVSVTTAPPTLLVCINQTASIHDPVVAGGRFCVNLLGVQHEPLVPVFSGSMLGEDRFGSGEWRDDGGVPYLADAQAALFCRTISTTPYGSHSVIVGEVEGVRLADGETRPLVYQEGRLVRTVALEEVVG